MSVLQQLIVKRHGLQQSLTLRRKLGTVQSDFTFEPNRKGDATQASQRLRIGGRAQFAEVVERVRGPGVIQTLPPKNRVGHILQVHGVVKTGRVNFCGSGVGRAGTEKPEQQPSPNTE